MSDPRVQFSNGNLSSSGSVELFEDTKYLNRLDFDQIYHSTPLYNIQNSLKGEIINRRCAEVITPDQLLLKGTLRYIVCRSTAERETLINLLDNTLKNQYKTIIISSRQLFNCEKHYIVKVNLRSSNIDIDYNKPKLSPFNYSYSFETKSGQQTKNRDTPVQRWQLENFQGEYTFSIKIDNHIAYKGKFKP